MKVIIESLIILAAYLQPAKLEPPLSPNPQKALKSVKLEPNYLAELPALRKRRGHHADLFSNLSAGQCRQRVKRVKNRADLLFFEAPKRGVAVPMRIKSVLSKVSFRVPPKSSAFGILDCRQALLWLEEAKVLSASGIAAIHIGNFYRKGARLPKKKARKSQHAYGLAADVIGVTLGDGRYASVEDHFYGELGAPVCGPHAKVLSPPAGKNISSAQAEDFRERGIHLRNLVCDWAARGVFHHILTPNYNTAHFNHFHVDIKRSNKWFMIK